MHAQATVDPSICVDCVCVCVLQRIEAPQVTLSTCEKCSKIKRAGSLT